MKSGKLIAVSPFYIHTASLYASDCQIAFYEASTCEFNMSAIITPQFEIHRIFIFRVPFRMEGKWNNSTESSGSVLIYLWSRDGLPTCPGCTPSLALCIGSSFNACPLLYFYRNKCKSPPKSKRAKHIYSRMSQMFTLKTTCWLE